MYVLIEGDEALLVDANPSMEAVEFLEQAGVKKATVILTHEHYDHTAGVNRLRQICDCNVVCTEICARYIQDPRKNLSQYCSAQYVMLDEPVRGQALALLQPFSCTADTFFSGEMELSFCGHKLRITETPGHSKASLCAVLDNTIVFTGDSLVPHTAVVTRLPGGSRTDYLAHVLPYLQSLPEDIWVLPGHFDGVWLKDVMKEVNEYVAQG